MSKQHIVNLHPYNIVIKNIVCGKSQNMLSVLDICLTPNLHDLIHIKYGFFI